MKTLIVVDMQNDFIDGALANPAAAAIVEPLVEYIKNFEGDILFTQDTHYNCSYLNTQEGKNLPIPHCIVGTKGWDVRDELKEEAHNAWHYGRASYVQYYTKDSFGDVSEFADSESVSNADEIYLCGTCTDICVISVALNLKARFPEVKMYCIADLCAGLTPEKHAAALEVMRSCQIEVI